MKTGQRKEEETMHYIPNYSVQLIRDGSYKADKRKVSSPELVFKILKPICDPLPKEHIFVVLLNVKNDVIGINTVSIGTVSSSLAHPREVFQPAILANATSIILAHNHPSGDIRPSNDDLKVTKRMKDAGDILGIQVLDHVIIGTDDYYSMKANDEI